jgi:hypothetical protein
MKRIDLRKALRILKFGLLSGFLWSLIPGVLGEGLFHLTTAALLIIAGCLAGIVVTFGQATILPRCNRFGIFVLGILSLPLGAFCFGLFASVVGNTFGAIVPEWRGKPESPFTTGLVFAMLCVPMAVVLLPLSVFTTFRLRRFLQVKN